MGGFGKWLGGGLGFRNGRSHRSSSWIPCRIYGRQYQQLLPQAILQVTRTTTPGAFGVSLLVLIAAVMKADGKVVKSELDYVKQFFIRQFGNDSAAEATVMLRDLLKKDIPVRDVCQQISRNMDYSSRLQLLHLLFNVSLADGHPNPV